MGAFPRIWIIKGDPQGDGTLKCREVYPNIEQVVKYVDWPNENEIEGRMVEKGEHLPHRGGRYWYEITIQRQLLKVDFTNKTARQAYRSVAIVLKKKFPERKLIIVQLY